MDVEGEDHFDHERLKRTMVRMRFRDLKRLKSCEVCLLSH